MIVLLVTTPQPQPVAPDVIAAATNSFLNLIGQFGVAVAMKAVHVASSSNVDLVSAVASTVAGASEGESLLVLVVTQSGGIGGDLLSMLAGVLASNPTAKTNVAIQRVLSTGIMNQKRIRRVASGFSLVLERDCLVENMLGTLQELARVTLRLRRITLHLQEQVSIWSQNMVSVKHGLPAINESLDLYLIGPVPLEESARSAAIKSECSHRATLVSHSTNAMVSYFSGLKTIELRLTSTKDSTVPTHKMRMGGIDGISIECLCAGSASMFSNPSIESSSSLSSSPMNQELEDESSNNSPKRLKIERSESMNFYLIIPNIKTEQDEVEASTKPTFVKRLLLENIGWTPDVISLFSSFITIYTSLPSSEIPSELFTKAAESFKILATLIQHDSLASSLFPTTPTPQERKYLCHTLIHEILSITSSSSSFPSTNSSGFKYLHTTATERLSPILMMDDDEQKISSPPVQLHQPFTNQHFQIKTRIIKSIHTPNSENPHLTKDLPHLFKGPKHLTQDPRMVPSYLKVYPPAPADLAWEAALDKSVSEGKETLWSRYVRMRGTGARKEAMVARTGGMEVVRLKGMNLELGGGQGGGFKGKGGQLVPMAFD
ncbi:UNVERIFIED_CONTAM: hypothetical protein HDU68_012893 [Siphonaria sp. JEL0065]|nr:hypothetical protein HDU68_012893 [Siphonaria sp. JEL0065]